VVIWSIYYNTAREMSISVGFYYCYQERLFELTFSLIEKPTVFDGALTTKHFETTSKMLY